MYKRQLRPSVLFIGGVTTADPPDCLCTGVVLDTDADGIIDCEDLCPLGLDPGEPCDDGDCPPVCPGCACARLPVAVTTTPTPVAAAPPIDQRVLTFAPESEPSTPEPQEILRVPIARAS